MCPSRRAVLLGAGSAAGLVTLAACGADGGTPGPTGGSAPPSEGGGSSAPSVGSGSPAPSGAEPLVALADVPVGGAVAVTTPDGAEILVAQPSEGEVVAFSAICTHQGCVVTPEDGTLRCPCHGSEFDLATGDALRGPAEDPLPAVSVEVRDGGVVAS
ncbi:Rieske (2Fe-2S) protein [Georgenia sp. MJ206]|uniref:Rieske (2Fe-2S) protein n=1 Tax=Georgenia wangjunii TaxID=3117730 RepID=UPI002F26DE5F